jgi:hypothetical protein
LGAEEIMLKMAPTTDNPTGHADSGEKKQTPATFIMGLPPDMPATDVVARGKLAGLVFTESWVYKVRRAARAEKTQRGAARAKGTKSRAATSPTAAPKPVGTRPRGAPSGPKRAGGTPGERPLSKQEFIRSFPVGMNAAEVIEIAQGMGIQLTFGELIEAMSAPPGPAEGTLKRPGRAAEESKPSEVLEQEDAELVELILRVGLERVEQVLGRVKAGIRAMRGA